MVAEIKRNENTMFDAEKIKNDIENHTNKQIFYWDEIQPKYISWNFYKSYVNKKPKFDTLGLTTFLRTYSRYIPSIRRREKWCECVLRVVEYSMSLDNREYIGKREEAEQLFDAIFNLKTFSKINQKII